MSELATETAVPGVEDGRLPEVELTTLAAVERRVLWLAMRIVDYANRERPKADELKVGGHQASSASMVSLMTALYFADLAATDRVAVKPHASPVLHAIEYLLGRLPRAYLTQLRELGGLQAYPSRTKDVFPVDFSTGSVGLGAAAPLFAAVTDRYLASHFGPRPGGRFISLLGDAELDEGNVWEAIMEPGTQGLGNVLWIVDLNRQSLDRVIPGIKAQQLERQFENAGWHVLELKYGSRLREAYGRKGGELLRRRIDELRNERYQALFAAGEEEIVDELLSGCADGEERDRLGALLEHYGGQVGPLIKDLGGHDLGDLVAALRATRLEETRPSVIFAYTIKGFGLPIAGRPMNHSALLSGEQIDELRRSSELDREGEWDAFGPDTPEGRLCATAAARLERPQSGQALAIPVPERLSTRDGAKTSTQAALGRVLLDLSRSEELAERIVTLSPDVSVSTNLGGWLNKVGVYGPEAEPVHDAMEDSPLRWSVGPEGRHIELGISEMNLFLLLGQLGLAADLQGEQLFPIGTVYDPFVCRGLEGLIYSVYSGSRFIVAGTPSGISLSREGGAHQSTITPGIGIELPGLTYAEPCYARELEWLLLEGLRRLQEPDGEALYLRLTTKPIEQRPFAELLERRDEAAVRADVLAGAYWLREPGAGEDGVVLAACGALVPETLAAAEALAEDEGIDAGVLVVSSPDRLYRDWRACRLAPLRGAEPAVSHLDRLVDPAGRGLPLVTVIDGASHALAFLGGCLGVPVVPLGVDRFGQVGSQPSLYETYDLSAEAIVTAALVALGG